MGLPMEVPGVRKGNSIPIQNPAAIPCKIPPYQT